MQYEHSVCQLPHSRTGDSRTKSTPKVGTQCPPDAPQTALVRDREQQHTTHTASRRTGPRRWLRAVTWLIAAGLHPKANATTQRVAELLAADMDYDTGHVLYRLEHRAAQVSRATIARHVGYLRELGALAWVEHGSRTNRRRLMGLTGYAATATVYAAVIPPSFDHAMGHRIVGSGYGARIVVDYRTQPEPVDNPPVENPGTEARETPSLTVVKEVGQVEVVGGFKDTSRKRATPSTASTSPSTKTNNASSKPRTARRSPAQVARDIWIARQVRPRVNWTQSESLRRLAFALRPLIDRGLNADSIAAELHSWWLDWRPAKPASYIRAYLARQAEQGRLAGASEAMSDAEWDAYHRQRVAEQQALEAQRAADAQAERDERTDEDRRIAQEYGWTTGMFEVARHYDEDPEDALDLYGLNLCSRAVRMTSSTAFSQGAFA